MSNKQFTVEEVNILDHYEQTKIRVKKLEEKIYKETGNRTRFLSDRPYSEIEAMLPLYLGSNIKLAMPVEGQIVKATILSKQKDWLVLDAGFKDNIYIELKGPEVDIITQRELKYGDIIDVLITNVDEDNFEIRGSLSSLVKLQVNRELEKALNGDSLAFFKAFIKELTPAGYFVEITIAGLKTNAFMPNTLAGINKLPDPKSIVGQTLEVMIENQTKEGFIVSRKKYLQSLIKEKIQSLKSNHIYTGNVTGTTDFGIFVEFETCLTGMIHRANVNPELVQNISKIEPGTEIEFYIKEIVKDKLILTQILRETLWDTLKIGDRIVGKVKSQKNFGALISLDEETNGLIHQSEIERAGLKLHEGQEIRVKVISVQRSERKIFLAPDNN